MARNGLGDRALGLLEAIGTVGSSALAEIPRGYGNIAGLLATSDLDQATAYGDRVADNLIYGPTERSAPYLQALGGAMQSLYEIPAPLTGISAKDMYQGTQSAITSQDPSVAGPLGMGFEGLLAVGLPGIKPARRMSLFDDLNIPTEIAPTIERAVDVNPEIEGILPYLTRNEAQRVTPGTANQLVATYNAINPEELIGAAVEGAPKIGWYEQTAEALNTIMGDDTPRFSALLAALSPQTSVEMNLLNTVNTWSNWEKAGRPTDPDKIIEIMGQSVLGDKGVDSVLGAWRNNAIRALTAAPDELTGNILLSGPKVNDFSQSVQGDLSRFVNDAWQANLTGIPQSYFGGTGPMPGYSPGYLGASAAGRKAAEQMSLELGKDIMPSEVQETGWSFAKALYEQMASMRGAGQNVTAEDIVRNNMLETSRISDVPDFATLFTQPEYGTPLREIGYGSLIDRAAGAAQGIGRKDISGSARPDAAINVARRLDSLYDHRQFISATTPIRPRFIDTQAATSGRNRSVVPYRISSRRSVPLEFGASGRPHSPSQEIQRASGIDFPDVYQLNQSAQDRRAFANVMREAQASRGAIGRSVDVYDPADYKGYKLFTTQDGSSGFAISPSGELSSVVSKRGSGIRGFSDAALAAAVSNGARWLNAFDTVLPQKYARFGFKPVARLKFDEDFARSDWGDEAVDAFMQSVKGFQSGKPDLVFMVYDPAFKDTVANNVGGKLVDDWDKAMEIVDKEKAKLSKKESGK